MRSTDFIGKEVALYPSDTYKKNAILLSIDENGYVFKITACEKGSGYVEGEVIFINHHCPMKWSLKLNRITDK